MGARWQMLPGSHLVEPPTSTMSRPIGRTKTRVDSSKLVRELCGVKDLREQMLERKAEPSWRRRFQHVAGIENHCKRNSKEVSGQHCAWFYRSMERSQ